MFKNKINALFNAEQYHGWGKTKRYFEGWYYKLLNADATEAYAFIPGIAMDENGHQQAFVQVLDGKRLTASYHKFDAKDFVPKGGTFEVNVGNSFFSKDKIRLDLPNATGTLNFQDLTPWSSSWYSPNIMGPFSFMPFMQCYHGILSMNHTIQGSLNLPPIIFQDYVNRMLTIKR